MLDAKIANKTTKRIVFEAKSTREISEEAAKQAQSSLGYIPAGYGFDDFEVKMCPVLHTYSARWSCSTSCE